MGVCAAKKGEKIVLVVSCVKLVEANLPRLQVLKDLYFKDSVYKADDDKFVENIIEMLKWMNKKKATLNFNKYKIIQVIYISV